MSQYTSLAHPVVGVALEAMNAHDAASLAALFIARGSVEDENETHKGRRAIRRWFHATPTIRLEPLKEESSAAEYVLEARAYGHFPSSPLKFRYHFLLCGERISTLRISVL